MPIVCKVVCDSCKLCAEIEGVHNADEVYMPEDWVECGYCNDTFCGDCSISDKEYMYSDDQCKKCRQASLEEKRKQRIQKKQQQQKQQQEKKKVSKQTMEVSEDESDDD